jgi:hypothetical protein
MRRRFDPIDSEVLCEVQQLSDEVHHEPEELHVQIEQIVNESHHQDLPFAGPEIAVQEPFEVPGELSLSLRRRRSRIRIRIKKSPPSSDTFVFIHVKSTCEV